MTRVLVWVTCLILGTSCQVSRTIRESNGPMVSDTELLTTILEQQNPGPFLGQGSLTIETQEKGQRLTCKVRFNGNDTLKVEVNTGFGYGLINLWLTTDSLFISNRLTNQFVSTTYESDELQQLLTFPFGYADIQTLFLGRLVLSPDSRLVNVIREEDDLIYLFRSSGGSEKIWVNTNLKKPIRILRSDRRGNTILDIMLQRYKAVKAGQMAHQIQLLRPGSQEKVSLYFNSLEPSDVTNLPVTIPPAMERIRL